MCRSFRHTFRVELDWVVTSTVPVCTGAAARDRQVRGGVAAVAFREHPERERGDGRRSNGQSERSALSRLRVPSARPGRIHLRAQQRLLSQMNNPFTFAPFVKTYTVLYSYGDAGPPEHQQNSSLDALISTLIYIMYLFCSTCLIISLAN